MNVMENRIWCHETEDKCFCVIFFSVFKRWRRNLSALESVKVRDALTVQSRVNLRPTSVLVPQSKSSRYLRFGRESLLNLLCNIMVPSMVSAFSNMISLYSRPIVTWIFMLFFLFQAARLPLKDSVIFVCVNVIQSGVKVLWWCQYYHNYFLLHQWINGIQGFISNILAALFFLL